MEFAPCQHGFEDVAGVHGSFRLSCPNDIVELINKEDDPSVRFCYFVYNRFQPFLKLTPEFGTCYESPYVQCKQGFVLKPIGNITLKNALSQAFHNRGFTNAGLSDEDRIVLCPP